MHIDPIRHFISHDIHLDMRLIFPEADHLPIPRDPVRLRCAAQIHCFEEICFSLGIHAIENIDALIKIQLQMSVISEIAYFYGLHPHNTPTVIS